MTIAAVLELPPLAAASDDALLATQRSLAEVRRQVDAAASRVADEIARRSRPELGYDGLAQRLGARTPAHLVQRITGTSVREAGTLVRAGAMQTDAAPSWLQQVGQAVAAARISLDAAEVIRSGLGTPTDAIPAAELERAAATLLVEAPTLTLERLAARARDLRAALDLGAVASREQAMRERRYLHLTPMPDGMTRISGLLDPESAAIVTAAVDAATSPRRGGPRFVDPTERARAETIAADPRSTEQLALDTLIELTRLGTAVAPNALLGAKRPAVTLHVTADDLRTGRGIARFEGQSAPISIDTAARMVCEVGVLPVLFEGGQVVNLGREQRLYTRRQTLALAARDGGCTFPECERPPSWTEAHHINEWRRDRGGTDIADGVLLCRHHHLLVHNNGWRVTRDGADYAFVPPPELDARQRPIPAQRRALVARAS
ncbi:DUF222 domain-containing protein [Leifsonia sp. H3M29-4]|uniref:HNH endonuclease signature motif containing protein n=1 Tax=Salinibacterium metalliresistens TaxID=3031321 RepID=UPI0023DBC0CA|nr:HNH endonuclease signature motif containing protein [Salinibacterium metalliresistens]MDF1478219.1 DUF222 domain-containing protein [Salinibacterium metalliresistens]